MNGVTQPRIFTPSLRRLNQNTSLGYACIEYAEKVLGKELYPWQKFALIHALEIAGSLKGKWTFRFRTVLFLISRQNGKTVLSTSGSGKVKDLIYAVYGRETSKELIPLSYEDEVLKVSGFLGKPILAKGSRSFENYFINGRNSSLPLHFRIPDKYMKNH